MWEKIKIENLKEGIEYKVMDNQSFVVKAKFDGECFRNSVTKEVIKKPARIWE